MIALKNVAYIYPGKVIPTLDRIDFSFASSGFYLIEGASGAGKSTLLRLMSGFHRPAEGTVLYGDIDLFSLKERGAYMFAMKKFSKNLPIPVRVLFTRTN